MARLHRIASRRPALVALVLAAATLLVAAPLAHADVWANVGPAPSLGGLKGGPAPWRYDIDEHFTAISAGVFSGIDVSGLLPMVAYFFAKELWLLTSWLANILIELFGFAFSLDLVDGSAATHGAGALGPVSRAIGSIYSTVFGGPWMVLAFSVAGMWAMWKALVQRRYAETAGQLALSLIYVGIAFFFVLQPAQTIGAASHWTNEMSAAFLSIAKDGEPTSQSEAKEAGADQLFGLLVAQPWAVLEFGGLDHCVKAAHGSGSEPESVGVEPLPESSARRLEAGEEVSAGGKTCINNLKKYGPHFLRSEPGSKEREEEFDALSAGDSSKLPDADPGKADGSYKLGPADKPAAAAMEKEGQYQRLLVSIVVFCAELGAFLLLGALSIGVITAQVLLLLLLAFSPVALVAAAIPGRGHQFFKSWLSKLAGYLLRKAAYSLILAILLAVCAAISAATSELGWLFSFGLQCAFFWAVFLQRRSLTEDLVGIATGPGAPARDRVLDLLGIYYGARVLGGVTRPARRAAGGAGRTGLRAGGWFLGRGRSGPSPAPLRAPGVPIAGLRHGKDIGGARTGNPAEEPITATADSGATGGGRADGGREATGDAEPERPDRPAGAGGPDAEPERGGRRDRRPDEARRPRKDEDGKRDEGGDQPGGPAPRPREDRKATRPDRAPGDAGDVPRQEDRRGGLADELRADEERPERREKPTGDEPRRPSGGRRPSTPPEDRPPSDRGRDDDVEDGR
jgi:hypothetical protein